MKSHPSFFENRILFNEKIKQGRPSRHLSKIKSGAVFGNFTVTEESILRISEKVPPNKDRRVNRSTYYVNVDCSCGNNMWVKCTYLIEKNHKSCSKCRADVRLGAYKSLKEMKVWHTRCYQIRTSAKQQNLEFNLTPEFLKQLFIFQSGKCAITGDEIIVKKGNVSLDKIIPKLGYVTGNVQWTNKKSNIMKQDMSMDELIIWCKKVINKNRSLIIKKFKHNPSFQNELF